MTLQYNNKNINYQEVAEQLQLYEYIILEVISLSGIQLRISRALFNCYISKLPTTSTRLNIHY